ncbi:PAS domain S-box-containing protein [Paucimonas lemoignei]|uniref:histidine kinase n=1 Tax=Paucimonas lemoignei TaxID=29443 RepID=A0A4R3I3P2_PAULE|nr:PAS domain-containing sensor histidine kinase [Paucimonas lemoignei]TCS39315.1 PAS domain S-box-containing protein [Paucimonas lemoignei]
MDESDRFQLFIDRVTDYAIYFISPEGIVRTWNAGAVRFKGYTADDIIGQHFSKFYTEEDRARNLPEHALRTALDHGKFESEGWRVRKDGSRFWAHVVIDPVRDVEGNLIGFAKITRDITERKAVAESLQASQEQFRLLVQGVTDYAIYMLSPSGNITNWNAGAKRIKGYDETEVVGTHFSRFYTEEDRANGLPATALATAVKEGGFESEGWRRRKDGSHFWAHVVIDPIYDESGAHIGFAKVTRDISERRESAKALEKAKEALFHSQKLEAIGKLTGGVAHDFNNLLNVIVTGLDVLVNEVNTPTGTKMLESMRRAAMRGATLTQQLLTFARQQPLKQEKCNINRIIESFESVLRRAGKTSVGFNMKLESNLPPVLIDAAQLEAALLNLVVNASDATPDGGTITLETSTVELEDNEVKLLPAGKYVRVAVQDTGAGMPPDVAARAIEPFFTTKPVGKGTGLGLSQVFGLVQQSGGDLQIDSAIGKGTTVSFFLPVIALEDGEDMDAGKAVVSEKALVVDDQPDVLEVAVELFRAMGYDVLSANNGEQALDILKRTPSIDVLFSDVIMPGISGIELGKQARTINPDIKVILASGYAAPALQAQNDDLGDFELLTKPYRMAEVMKKLRA